MDPEPLFFHNERQTGSLIDLPRPLTYINHLRLERQIYNTTVYKALDLVSDRVWHDHRIIYQKLRCLQIRSKNFNKNYKIKDCTTLFAKRLNRIERARFTVKKADCQKELEQSASDRMAVFQLQYFCSKNML